MEGFVFIIVKMSSNNESSIRKRDLSLNRVLVIPKNTGHNPALLTAVQNRCVLGMLHQELAQECSPPANSLSPHKDLPKLFNHILEFLRLEVLFNGRKHFVLRRYSEFQTLHRKLKKILRAPDFPSKRNQHLRTKPLEQRQQELEDYIQVILYQNEIVPQELLDFLQVKHFHAASKNCSSDENQSDDSLEQDYRFQLFNQRVVGFLADPYQLESSSDLPDIVVAGVMEGFYPRDVKVSFKKNCSKPSIPAGVTCAPELPVHPRIPTITISRINRSSLPESLTSQVYI